MALALCPFVTLANTERRERYLPLLREICKETQAHEPECLSYCWMRQSPDTVDHSAKDVYVCGLEVYANEEALAVTHRSKEQYKHMRATVAVNPIITWPVEGLQPLTPAGVGWLSNSDSTEVLDADTFVYLSDYTISKEEARSFVLSEIEKLVQKFKANTTIQSFWVLKPKDPVVTDRLLVFARFASRRSFDAIRDDLVRVESIVKNGHGSSQVGLWVGAGFGFIRPNQL